MSDMYEENDSLIENAGAELANAAAKQQADEIREQTQSSFSVETNEIQQQTAILHTNIQAQKQLNEEKQKTITIQEALDKAISESLKQRNEMLVYHGSPNDFKSYIGNTVPVQGREFGKGVYLSRVKDDAKDYAVSPLEIEGYKTYKDLKSSYKTHISLLQKHLEGTTEPGFKHPFADLSEEELKDYQNQIKSELKQYKKEYIKLLLSKNNYNTFFPKGYVYTDAIPKDNGYNYFDATDSSRIYNTKFLSNRSNRDDVKTVLSGLNQFENGQNIFRTLIKEFGNTDISSILSDMKFIGTRHSYDGNENIVLYNAQDAKHISQEDVYANDYNDLFGEQGRQKIKYFEDSLQGLANLINTITRDKSDSNLSIKAKDQIISINPTPVNDLILTKDGRAFITDDADNIIATKNLGFEGVNTEVLKQLIDEAITKTNLRNIGYHGTRYTFSEYDLKKIGTGNGANHYGDGLYMSDTKSVAAGYATDIAFRKNRDTTNRNKWTKDILHYESFEDALDGIQKTIDEATSKLFELTEKIEENNYDYSWDRDYDIGVTSYLSDKIDFYKNIKDRMEMVDDPDYILNGYKQNLMTVSYPRGMYLNFDKEYPMDSLRSMIYDFKTDDGYEGVRGFDNEDREYYADVLEDLLKTYTNSIRREQGITPDTISGFQLFGILQDWVGPSTAGNLLNALGFSGNNYRSAMDNPWYANGTERNILQYNPEESKILSIEDLSAGDKQRLFGNDNNIIPYVTYLDTALRKFGDNIDFLNTMIEKTKNISIQAGNQVIPITPTPVNDLVLTKDGRAYITDDADSIIATKDLGSLGKGQQKVRDEYGNQFGILSNQDSVAIARLADALENFVDDSTWKKIEQDINKIKSNGGVGAESVDTVLGKNYNYKKSVAMYVDNSVDEYLNNFYQNYRHFNELSRRKDKLKSKVVLTNAEMKKISSFEMFQNTNKNELDKIKTKYKNLAVLQKEMAAYGNAKDIPVSKMTRFKEEMEDLLQITGKLNPKLEKIIKDAKGDFPSKRSYDTYKYALIRNSSQQKDFELDEEMPANFVSTGNIKDSFRRTVFNSATGYRQRRGLTGFAANLGYSASGTLLAVGLGAFAKALTDATKYVNEFGKASLNAYAQIESVKTNLGIVYGSQSEADETFGQIAAYAVKSPFGVETVSRFAVQLKQSGVYASYLMDTLKQIGDVAGGNQQKFGNIANAFAQIEANGKATTRQLREFATAGIPIYAQLSKQLGKGVEQIRKMTEEGKITSTIIEEAFRQLTSNGGMFENAVEIGARTYAARKQNLLDARQLAQSEVGQWLFNLGGTGMNDTIGSTLLSIRESINDGIKDWAHLKNIDKNVDNIEKREFRVNTLKTAIEEAEKNGDKTLANELKKELADIYKASSISEDRAKLAASYEAASKIINSGKLWNPDNRYANSAFMRMATFGLGNTKLGRKAFFGLDKITGSLLGNSDLIKNAQTEIEYINSTYTKKQFEKANHILEKYFNEFIEKTVEGFMQKGYDAVASAAEKNEKSLYKVQQKSDDLWKQNDIGKREENARKRKEWEEQLATYDKLSPYITDTGLLVEGVITDVETLSQILESGIINTLSEFNLNPENLAISGKIFDRITDGKSLKEIQLLEQENIQNWNTLADKIKSLDSLQPKTDQEQRVIDELKKTLFEIGQDGTLTDELKKNDGKIVSNFLKTLKESIDTLKEADSKLADLIPKYLSYNGEKSQRGRTWDELYGYTIPLRSIFLQSNLGLSSDILKYNPDISEQSLLDMYTANIQRTGINGLIQGVLTSGASSSLISQLLDYKNISEQPVRVTVDKPNTLFQQLIKDLDKTEYRNQFGAAELDWDAAQMSLEDFANSLLSATSVTEAFVNQRQNTIDTLNAFIANAVTHTLSGEDIYSENFKTELAALSGDLEALGVNTFDLAEANKNGKDAVLEYVTSLRDNLQSTQSLNQSFVNLKKKIDDVNGQIANQRSENFYERNRYQLPGLELFNEGNVKSIISDVFATFKPIQETLSTYSVIKQSERAEDLLLDILNTANISGNRSDKAYSELSELEFLNSKGKHLSYEDYLASTFRDDAITAENFEKMVKTGYLKSKAEALKIFINFWDGVVTLISSTGTLDQYQKEISNMKHIPLRSRFLQNDLNLDSSILNYNPKMSEKDIYKSYIDQNLRDSISQAIQSGYNAGFNTVEIGKLLSYSVKNAFDVDQLDWESTQLALDRFASGLEVATSVTDSYVNRNKSTIENLNKFISEAITYTLTADQMYNEENISELKNLANTLNASGLNIFGKLIEETEDGFVRVKEGALSYATELRDNLQSTQSLRQSFLNLKNAIDDVNKKVIEQKGEVFFQENKDSFSALIGLSDENKKNFMTSIFNAVESQKELFKLDDYLSKQEKTEDLITEFLNTYKNEENFMTQLESRAGIWKYFANRGSNLTWDEYSISNEAAKNKDVNESNFRDKVDTGYFSNRAESYQLMIDFWKGMEMLLNSTFKLDEVQKEAKVNDVRPLWQRILNQTFGTDLELFKNGGIKNGRQAVDIWNAQQQREAIKTTARAMMNTMSVRDVFTRILGGNYTGKNYVNWNTSGNGVTQINWKEAYKSVKDFSLSVESSAQVSRAYADSLQNEVSTLRDFMSSAFTITEDAANLYDEDYQKQLGSLAKNIKTLDQNVYDMMFSVQEVNGKEFIQFRENASAAAYELLEQKEGLVAFASSIASAKEKIDELGKQITSTIISRDIAYGKYNVGKLSGLRKEDKNTFLSFVNEEFQKDEWKNLIDNSELSGQTILETFLNNRATNSLLGINTKAIEQYRTEQANAKSNYDSYYAKARNRFIQIMDERAANLDDVTFWSKNFDLDKISSIKASAQKWQEMSDKQKDEYIKNNLFKRGSTSYTDELLKWKEKKDELDTFVNNSSDSSEWDKLFENLDKLLEKVVSLAKATKEEEFANGFSNLLSLNTEEGLSGKDRLRSILFDSAIYGNNTLRGQRALDYMGIKAGTSYAEWRDSVFKGADGSNNFKQLLGKMSREDLLKYKEDGLWNNFEDIDSVPTEKLLEILVRGQSIGSEESRNNITDFFISLRTEAELAKDAFEDLGETIMSTFESSIVDGYSQTLKQVGKDVLLLNTSTKTAAEYGKDYLDIWRNIGQSMLDSIGPALTQAGLSMIINNPSYWRAGLAMIAAGGVLSLASGMLDSSEKDSRAQEEARLQNLRSLLLEIIEQAKIDADYYAKNSIHQNALNEAKQISVNDAIIAPNGNVITTAPDDYLIATKTPGSLSGGQTVVNFTMVDQSTGAKVKVQSTEQRRNPDGSVDIVAVVGAIMDERIANGEADGAFSARDQRLSGRHFVM